MHNAKQHCHNYDSKVHRPPTNYRLLPAQQVLHKQA